MTRTVELQPNAFRVHLLFPLADNEGEPFDQDVWAWWRDQMTTLFRGFSIMGTVEGWWEGYTDEHRSVAVVVNSDGELESIRSFLAEARPHFRQEAMVLEVSAVRFELIT